VYYWTWQAAPLKATTSYQRVAGQLIV